MNLAVILVQRDRQPELIWPTNQPELIQPSWHTNLPELIWPRCAQEGSVLFTFQGAMQVTLHDIPESWQRYTGLLLKVAH